LRWVRRGTCAELWEAEIDLEDMEEEEFGTRAEIQEQIKKIKNEKEFQTLLEGYLLATFPDQRIIREFGFKGWKIADSQIDFVVGKDQRIPIEVN